MSTAVIAGRFQSPYIHEGHKHLIDTAIKECDTVIVLIGCTLIVDERNKYSYEYRSQIIQELYPNIVISRIHDEDTDELWSEQLDHLLKIVDFDDVVLYGSRDSFIPRYSGIHPTRYVEEIPGISATDIRNSKPKEG